MVKLGTNVVDEVRRRVQQDTLGRRGHKHDPLYTVRGLLRRGVEHPTDRQVARLNAALVAGDPGFEDTVAWHAYQQLRSIYQADTAADGRRQSEQVIATFATGPVAEVARLERMLRRWRSHVLARFDEAAGSVSNGGTEAVNLIIEKPRRLAHGFRTFEHYRLRTCSPPQDNAATDDQSPTLRSEDPVLVAQCHRRDSGDVGWIDGRQPDIPERRGDRPPRANRLRPDQGVGIEPPGRRMVQSRLDCRTASRTPGMAVHLRSSPGSWGGQQDDPPYPAPAFATSRMPRGYLPARNSALAPSRTTDILSLQAEIDQVDGADTRR